MEKKKKRLSQITQQLFEIGKLPPQAVDLEMAIIGALILDRDACNTVIDILPLEAFYKEQHMLIYRAIRTLWDAGHPIDILTVIQTLKASNDLEMAGGALYISQLTNRVGSAANTEYHARIVTQKAIQRKYIQGATEIIRKGYDETTDVFDMMLEADKIITDIGDLIISGTIPLFESAVQETVREIAETKSNDGIIGLPTPFKELNRLIKGWQKKLFYLLAGRPAMGKSTMLIDFVRCICNTDPSVPILIFSLEMTRSQLIKRIISAESGILFDLIQTGKLSNAQFNLLHETKERVKKWKLFIDDTAGLTIAQIRGIAKKYKTKEGIQFIGLDHIQKVTLGEEGKGVNREQEVNKVADRLKNTAKDLDLPIVALAQLSRAVDQRTGDHMPQLSDLRDSGGLEQEADSVLFLTRPVVYGITEDEEGNDIKDQAKIKVAKNRDGEVDEFKLRFNGHVSRFDELDAPLPSVHTDNSGSGSGETYTNQTMAPNEDFLKPNDNKDIPAPF